MVKTQIQIPDELYRQLKRLAEAKEWSLAETLRRGAELLLAAYPPPENFERDWKLPEPMNLGWKGLGPEELKEQAQMRDTAEPFHRKKAGR